MSVPLIPWEICNIPISIQDELTRRERVRTYRYVNNESGWDEKGDWSTYKGPTNSWVRVCSNSIGIPSLKKPRFVLYGGKDFYSVYGFKKIGKSDVNVIGYTPSGDPHTIENNLLSEYPIHTAVPEIYSIETVVQKELFRRAIISWTCFNFKQLEYMIPYFLSPGVSIIVEFGWNNFNPQSLIDLTDIETLVKHWKNPYPLYTDNIVASKGNYDVLFGIVTNYNWTIVGNKIQCVTEVTSKDRLYSGLPVSSAVIDGDSDKPEVGKASNDIITMTSIRGLSTQLKKLKETEKYRNKTEFIDSLLKSYIENSSKKDISQQTVKDEGLAITRFSEFLKSISPENYKGMFFGRSEINLGKKQIVDPTLNKTSIYDFDSTFSKDKVWVNLGFVVDFLNYCSDLIGPKNSRFFKVDVSDCVIGSHPNLISANGDEVLIPNGIAPKYHFGDIGSKYEIGNDLYFNQIPGSVGNGNSDLWFANERLRKICYHGLQARRNNLDEIINAMRNSEFPDQKFCFPFLSPQKVRFIDKTGEKYEKEYDPFKFGYFKDIYISVDKVVNILQDESVKSYSDIYKNIFSCLNKSCVNFWEFSLVDSTGREKKDDESEVFGSLKVVDNKMFPSGVNGQDVYSFNYNDADGVIKNLSFNPHLTDSQATRALFAPYQGSTKSVTSENLLDFRSEDVILNLTRTVSSEELSNNEVKNNIKDDIQSKLSVLQRYKPDVRQYQVTKEISNTVGATNYQINTLTNQQFLDLNRRLFLENQSKVVQPTIVQNRPTAFPENNSVGNKQVQFSTPTPIQPIQTQSVNDSQKEIIRLALPDSDLLNLLINDGDIENNNRYFGIQPGITVELTIQGIGGIRTFQVFKINNIPEPYSPDNILFRVVDVSNTLSTSGWETVIKAGILPLRGYVKKKLGLK